MKFTKKSILSSYGIGAPDNFHNVARAAYDRYNSSPWRRCKLCGMLWSNHSKGWHGVVFSRPTRVGFIVRALIRMEEAEEHRRAMMEYNRRLREQRDLWENGYYN